MLVNTALYCHRTVKLQHQLYFFFIDLNWFFFFKVAKTIRNVCALQEDKKNNRPKKMFLMNICLLTRVANILGEIIIYHTSSKGYQSNGITNTRVALAKVSPPIWTNLQSMERRRACSADLCSSVADETWCSCDQSARTASTAASARAHCFLAWSSFSVFVPAKSCLATAVTSHSFKGLRVVPTLSSSRHNTRTIVD